MGKTRQVRLKPANPFDLIRLLARSQHDPRKAVCELVQNSLDAQARHLQITWFTERRRRAIRLADDGEGVFPELTREEALRRIATTIGLSHKRSLTLLERRQLMLLGKYGIGLLGFWSVGQVMEIRSRVDGGETWCLRLFEDRPTAEVFRVPRRLLDAATGTEVTIRMVHEAAVRQIRPKRLRVYLASELRGQLLRRDVELHIHDRVARGRAPKHFVVKPERFLGRPLEDLGSLAVAGHEEADLELYLLPPEDERRGRVALCCGGTKVLDDLALVDGAEAPRAPWHEGRVEGIIDFPELEVAPGTRRGFLPNAAAAAFLDALAGLERALAERIAEEDRLREEQRQLSLARQIRRAFVPVARALPEYELFDVGGGPARADRQAEEGAPVGAGDAAAREGGRPPAEERAGETQEGWIFPPGPLAHVRLSPRRSQLPPGARRRLRARPLDADDRPVAGEVRFEWSLQGAGDLLADAAEALYTAPAHAAEARVMVRARQGEHTAAAEGEIAVLEDLVGEGRVAGIPEPQPVHMPEESWRSRLREGRWEFNEGHRDYLAASASETGRLRYLIHLFAKELVLRNFGGPADEEVLERMVEVLTRLPAK